MMGVLQWLHIFCLSVWIVFLSEAQSLRINITITPSTVTLTPDQADKGIGPVNVACRVKEPSLFFLTSVLATLSISRSLAGNQSESTIVSTTRGPARLEGDVPGAKVFGSLREKSIRVTLKRAGCGDGGLYTCTAEYFPTGIGDTIFPWYYHASDNLTVHVSPGPLVLTHSLSGRPEWVVGDILNMSCQGPLGTVLPGRQAEWVWEYRNARHKDAPWRPYDGNVADVESGPVAPHQHCYVRGSSTLTRRLTLEDSDRQYRCYVKLGGVSFQQYAADLDIGAARSTGSAEVSLQHKVLLGSGIGVSVLAVVGLVIVVVVWARKHRRQRSTMTQQSTNSALLPEHRDPNYYGEYLEPIVRRSSDEASGAARAMYDSLTVSDEDQRASIYSHIPIYEDLDLDNSQSCCACIPAL